MNTEYAMNLFEKFLIWFRGSLMVLGAAFVITVIMFCYGKTTIFQVIDNKELWENDREIAQALADIQDSERARAQAKLK